MLIMIERNADVEKLVLECREHSDAAFAELVSRYTPLIRKMISDFSVDFADDDELFSEACIALHQAAMSYDLAQSEVTFGLYAGICISNRLKSLLKKNEREQDRNELVSDTERISSGVDVESYIAAKDLCERVMRCARLLLSDYELQVFRMNLERCTTKDIAEALGKSQKSVDNAKYRISKRLRESSDVCHILSDID